MELKDNLSRLVINRGLAAYLHADALSAIVQVMHTLPGTPSGSLLLTHLSGGSMFTGVPALYLEGMDESAIQDQMTKEGEKPPTVRSLWGEACKLFSEVAKQAVQDAQHRRIPLEIYTRNVNSGKADVLDLPQEFTLMALEKVTAGGELASQTAAKAIAATLLLMAVDLLGVEVGDDWPPIGLTAYRRAYNELVGAAALYIVGVCPTDKQPRVLVNKLHAKRIKEVEKAEKVAAN